MLCPKCNAKNDNENMFCEVCGVKFEPPVICPKCQAKNRSDYKFCYVCGSTLVVTDDSKQQPQNTQSTQAEQQVANAQLSTINSDTERNNEKINPDKSLNTKLVFRQGNISCYEDHMIFGRYTIPYTDMSELEIIDNGVITHGGIKAYVLSTHQTLSLTANSPRSYSPVVNMINEKVRKAQQSRTVAVPKVKTDISELQSFVNSCSLSIESGEEKIFKIHGEEFSFSSDKDAYNKYRCFYYKLANVCGQMFKSEYFSVVNDCDSFLTNKNIVAQNYVNACVGKSVYHQLEKLIIDCFEMKGAKTKK